MKPKAGRKRLDHLLVHRGLADSVQKGLAMILAGEVRVNGNRADKAGMPVAEDARISVTSCAQKFVSRGGIKLEGALEDFSVDPKGRVCLDVGCSTGGFTDCLLQHGAARVYGIDVNVDQLDWKLRQNPPVWKFSACVPAGCLGLREIKSIFSTRAKRPWSRIAGRHAPRKNLPDHRHHLPSRRFDASSPSASSSAMAGSSRHPHHLRRSNRG